MPWSVGSTVSTGDVLTASRYNQDVIENLTVIGGAWTSFTPTWTNITVGNGTQSHAYVAAGKLHIVRMEFILGSTSAMAAASPEFTLPNGVSMKAAYDPLAYLGGAVYEDVSAAASYLGYVSPGASSNSVARLLLWRSDGTYPSVDTVVTTRPMTWATGDKIHATFIFEAA